MLKRINENYYFYKDTDNDMTFQLKYGDVGVYGYGRCWYFSVTIGGEKNMIYNFYTKDDGYGCSKKINNGILWTSIDEILENANSMIFDMTCP